MTASGYADLKFPKPRPQALAKRDRDAERERVSTAEDKIVRQRSGGRCEVIERVRAWTLAGWTMTRCNRRAVGEPHHLKGGYGRRNRGDSILALWKLDTCGQCHVEIHNGMLAPTDPQADAATCVFTRRR
uniref:HNH endonuclease n=1 Tax=viral metagenome TaxID=1070528 RepID=A0A6M3J860_9ZZZZ